MAKFGFTKKERYLNEKKDNQVLTAHEFLSKFFL